MIPGLCFCSAHSNSPDRHLHSSNRKTDQRISIEKNPTKINYKICVHDVNANSMEILQTSLLLPNSGWVRCVSFKNFSMSAWIP